MLMPTLLLLLLINPLCCYYCCCCEKDQFGNDEDQRSIDRPIDVISLLIKQLAVVADRICSITHADAPAVAADRSTFVAAAAAAAVTVAAAICY